MPRVEEIIPDGLAAEAEAARAWFVRDQSTDFKLTGIVDPEDVLEPDAATGARELQLILCGHQEGQDVCLKERFEVKAGTDGFQVARIEEAAQDSKLKNGSPAPLLDPPVGVRASWLDGVLAKHSFVVLVFYRGFW
ncbi:MAG: hypothetical protein JRE57_15575 [Deltaproteobacteria bacterium]|jgi:hypothetical protein|nr:hypothetical protein [Deltaproteobacteria bacterium]